jgi:hypothetical protein
VSAAKSEDWAFSSPAFPVFLYTSVAGCFFFLKVSGEMANLPHRCMELSSFFVAGPSDPAMRVYIRKELLV